MIRARQLVPLGLDSCLLGSVLLQDVRQHGQLVTGPAVLLAFLFPFQVLLRLRRLRHALTFPVTELELSGFSHEVYGRRVVVTVAAGGAIAVL